MAWKQVTHLLHAVASTNLKEKSQMADSCRVKSFLSCQ